MYCKNCKSRSLKKIIHIGNQPISSHFYTKKIYKLKNYPLDLYICMKCGLIQFKLLAKLDHMYGLNYGYRTSLSPLMINHMKNKYLKIINNLKKQKCNILDIGCNDGTFLNFFKKFININLYGIDPSAEKFKKYHSKRINLIVDYFEKKKLDKYFKDISFELITSYAMFYDVEDPNSFCKGINNLLTKNGKWILELSYFPLLLKNLTYDQICHEHVTYYTLTTFENIIKKNGLKILDFNLNNINGGSIEIICAKKNSKYTPKKEKINNQKKYEKSIDNDSYINFRNRIENVRKILNIFLEKNKGDVIGYGASTKGNIVLNHCNIDNKKLKYICDANKFKHGKFTPGTNIKIISKQKMRKQNPKFLLVLIWSFRKEVIQQEIKFLKKGGKLIFHLPMFHIIDKNNYKKFMNNNFKSFSYDF